MGTVEGYVGGVYRMYNSVATSATQRRFGAPFVNATHVAYVFESSEHDCENAYTPPSMSMSAALLEKHT